jgi:hypothetical protein
MQLRFGTKHMLTRQERRVHTDALGLYLSQAFTCMDANLKIALALNLFCEKAYKLEVVYTGLQESKVPACGFHGLHYLSLVVRCCASPVSGLLLRFPIAIQQRFRIQC